MAALNAEIISRKRVLDERAKAEPPGKITKLSKLHLKTDKQKGENMEDDDKKSFLNDNDGDEYQNEYETREHSFTKPLDPSGESGNKSYRDVHEQLKRKEEIYNKLKEDPNAVITNKLRENLMLDVSKNVYMYTDKYGRSKEVPINELPPNFWKNLGSSDEEDGSEDETEAEMLERQTEEAARRRHISGTRSMDRYSEYNEDSRSSRPRDSQSRAGDGSFDIRQWPHALRDDDTASESTAITSSNNTDLSRNRMWRKEQPGGVIYDRFGGKRMAPIDMPLTLETRHSNFMTEDRRDYGTLFYDLKTGAERQSRMDTLEHLRAQTLHHRRANNADEGDDPFAKFTPSYANNYLNQLAYKNGKDLAEVKRKLYGDFVDPKLVVYDRKK